MPAATAGRIYGGYTLAKDGIPTFRYRENGQQIEDTLRPVKGGLEHIITSNGKQTKETLSW